MASKQVAPGKPVFRAVLLVFRLLLAAVFISSGAVKFWSPAEFAQGIYAYKLLPLTAANLAAVTLPWIEILCGLSLLFGVMIAENAALLAGMLIVFTSAVALSMARGLDHACTCKIPFLTENLGPAKIIENLVMIGMSLTLFFAFRQREPSPSLPDAHPQDGQSHPA